MRKWKWFLTGSMLVTMMTVFTACGTGNTGKGDNVGNAADESAMDQGAVIEDAVEGDFTNEILPDTTEEAESPTEKPTENPTENPSDTDKEDKSVSDALGNGARSIGNGVGNAIEKAGDALSNAADKITGNGSGNTNMDNRNNVNNNTSTGTGTSGGR